MRIIVAQGMLMDGSMPPMGDDMMNESPKKKKQRKPKGEGKGKGKKKKDVSLDLNDSLNNSQDNFPEFPGPGGMPDEVYDFQDLPSDLPDKKAKKPRYVICMLACN